MAKADLTELVKRLTSYSEALDRNVARMQQAFDKLQESFGNLRRVWHGEAAERFYADWMQTADRLERTFETGRRLKALIDERLVSLRMADRPFDQGAGTAPTQMRMAFPLSTEEQKAFAGAVGRLKALRRRDAIPLLDEPGGDNYTRVILDIGGRSVSGRSEGPKTIPPKQPGTNYQAMRHAEANAIWQAVSLGVTANYATLYVDQEPCGFCLRSYRGLARWLGVDKLKVVWPDGSSKEYQAHERERADQGR